MKTTSAVLMSACLLIPSCGQPLLGGKNTIRSNTTITQDVKQTDVPDPESHSGYINPINNKDTYADYASLRFKTSMLETFYDELSDDTGDLQSEEVTEIYHQLRQRSSERLEMPDYDAMISTYVKDVLPMERKIEELECEIGQHHNAIDDMTQSSESSAEQRQAEIFKTIVTGMIEVNQTKIDTYEDIIKAYEAELENMASQLAQTIYSRAYETIIDDESHASAK